MSKMDSDYKCKPLQEYFGQIGDDEIDELIEDLAEVLCEFEKFKQGEHWKL